jgi:hypothetical protein
LHVVPRLRRQNQLALRGAVPPFRRACGWAGMQPQQFQ